MANEGHSLLYRYQAEYSLRTKADWQLRGCRPPAPDDGVLIILN